MSKETRIYMIRSESGHFKIGTTNHIKRRLSYLQTGSPVRLWVAAIGPGSVELERIWHKRLARYAVRGEWFGANPRTCEAIARMVEKGARPRIVRKASKRLAETNVVIDMDDVGSLDLKRQAEQSLRARGFDRVSDLVQLRPEQLFVLRGVGTVMARDIISKVSARGLSFASSEDVALLKRKGIAV